MSIYQFKKTAYEQFIASVKCNITTRKQGYTLPAGEMLTEADYELVDKFATLKQIKLAIVNWQVIDYLTAEDIFNHIDQQSSHIKRMKIYQDMKRNILKARKLKLYY